MASLKDHSTVQRRDAVIGNTLSERESVMLDIDRGRYFGVRDVGHAIWTELEEPTTVENLCQRLHQQFDIDAETCRTDVLAFLAELLDHGLIHANTPDTTA